MKLIVLNRIRVSKKQLMMITLFPRENGKGERFKIENYNDLGDKYNNYQHSKRMVLNDKQSHHKHQKLYLQNHYQQLISDPLCSNDCF